MQDMFWARISLCGLIHHRLAEVAPDGKIKNSLGELKSAASFLGSIGAGLGPMGLASGGKIGMEQLTSLLSSGMQSKRDYTSSCFDDVVEEADKNAEEEGQPTSQQLEGSRKNRLNPDLKKENISEEMIKDGEKSGTPQINGPIMACGEEGDEKVLKIYDAAGRLVDTITQDMLSLNPNIIMEKMGMAQQLSQMVSSQLDIGGYLQRFTGLPVKKIQSVASQVAQAKALADQSVDMARKSKKKKKKKKKKGEEVKPVAPNDPLYFYQDPKKKKGMFGFLSSSQSSAVKAPNLSKTGIGVANRVVKSLDLKDQWGLHAIGFTPLHDPNSAWNVVDATQKNIVVAVVDSGLDFEHEDSPEFIWTNAKEIPGNGIDDDSNGFVDDVHGWNFLDENHDFTDIRGHGTFVAGIIAAKQNNGVGIAGINPGAVIMPIKVADEEGETNSLQIFRGINYAVNHGAKVINVSLGSRSISVLEQEAIERAQEKGALVVVAAGNSNDNLVNFGPSSSKHSIAVGQIDYAGTRSTVSNWGPNLALVAPGEKIYSLCSKDNKHVLPSIRKKGYYTQDGTSFATPMVAAAASLIWAKNPNLSNEQVKDILLSSATDMGDEGWDAMTGAGLLNAQAALRAEGDDRLLVMFTNARLNKDANKKNVSVDLFGTVRGNFKEFTVEAGKGVRAKKFKPVAGPFKDSLDHQFIARVNIKENLRGSRDWILRIRAIDHMGQEYTATMPYTFE